MIQGREHLKYGVSAMLVGPVFDVRSHGQSRICRNLGRADADPHDAILAEASIDEEDVICATVDVAGPFGSLNGRAPALLSPTMEELAEEQYGLP